MMRSPGPSTVSDVYLCVPRSVRGFEVVDRVLLPFNLNPIRFDELSREHVCLPFLNRHGVPARVRCVTGKRIVNVVPLPTSLVTAIVPPSCSTMRLLMANPRPRPRFFVVTKSSKIALSRSAGMPEPVSVMLTSTCVPISGGGNRHAAAGLGCLNGVRNEVAIHASERECVSFDDDGFRGESRLDGNARLVRETAHRLDDVRDGAVDVEREALDGRGPRDVAQVVEHALERFHFAVDGARERLAVLGVVEDAHDQLAAVADVLDWM